MKQRYRRLTQLATLGLIVAIPFVNLYAAVLQSGTTFPVLEGNMIGGPASEVQPTSMPADRATNPVVRAAFLAIEHATAGLDSPLEYLLLFKGGSWSLVIFGIQFSDPLAFVAAVLAGRHFELSLFLSILVPVGLAVVAGPVWCGWLCPINTIGECNSWIRTRLEARGIELPHYRLSRRVKYAVLIGGIVSAFLFRVSIFPYLLPYAQFSREMFRLVFFRTLGYGALILALIFLADILVWRRGFCRYLCPGGAALSALGRHRLVSVDRDESDCLAGCVRCEEVCEPGLKPYLDEQGMGPDCTNCGRCIANCPGDALEYDVSKPDASDLSLSAKVGLVSIGALAASYVVGTVYVLL